MAHFAEIDDNNIVQRVIVVSEEFDDNESLGEAFCRNLTGSTLRWRKTSYNGNIRYNFAGQGMIYDEVNDAFISESPYPSWILNSSFKWEAPIQQENPYSIWNEETLSWDIIN